MYSTQLYSCQMFSSIATFTLYLKPIVYKKKKILQNTPQNTEFCTKKINEYTKKLNTKN